MHPLDPLSLDELHRACALVLASRPDAPQLRFASVRLDEPLKAEVLGFRPGDSTPRRAILVALNVATGEAFEAIVDLRAERVASLKRLPLDREPYGQPPVLLEEFQRCEAIVKADARWRAAMARRGLSEADIQRVQVDPFSSGFFGREFERGARIVRAVCYYRERLTDNGYAHPIEGVIAVVDFVKNQVVDLIDEDPVVPIPKQPRNYDRASLPAPRGDLKPLDISQRQGPSFEVEGWQVKWQNWSFRVGFTPREGLVLHQLGYGDRPIVYRASVTEMVVPYADPGASHYWKSAFDAGEYGLGSLANTLELGCDCIGHVHYFDIPAVDALGQPMLQQRAICLHEEDYGILWKHYEFRTGVFEARRSRRLVISFFATVGNYDYGFFWYLYQDGTIQLETKLTGIIQTAGVAPGARYAWGGMVAEGLGGPTHQHFFNVRLHMMVDGERNRVTEHEHVPRAWGPDNPYGNVFDTTSRLLERELDAARVADGSTGRYWKISSADQANALGAPRSYKLSVIPSPLLLAQEGSSVRTRGGFATKHVWVTRYHPDERYASGDYPNVSAGGEGLPRYVQQNRSIVDEDIVLWHSFGHTHFCKPEDFPVMPVEYAGFTLKPNGFFDQNPALDLPPERPVTCCEPNS
ncbi:MAG TPA: primary-amine oxidase [Polyangiales bacterium]|nr:primary-amine oxidase [Polyangiales bacterium]